LEDKGKDKDNNGNNDNNGCPTYAHVLCADILVGMATIVMNGNVRIQVQSVWTQPTQLRKMKGGKVIVMIAIESQLTCMKVGMAIVTAIDRQ
jgi:hypothetical protein